MTNDLWTKAILAARPVADHGIQRHHLALAPELEANLLTGCERADQVDEVILAANRLRIHL